MHRGYTIAAIVVGFLLFVSTVICGAILVGSNPPIDDDRIDLVTEQEWSAITRKRRNGVRLLVAGSIGVVAMILFTVYTQSKLGTKAVTAVRRRFSGTMRRSSGNIERIYDR